MKAKTIEIIFYVVMAVILTSMAVYSYKADKECKNGVVVQGIFGWVCVKESN